MSTKPTNAQATFRNAILDVRARLANTSYRLCTLADLARNTIETDTNTATQVRMNNALEQIGHSHTNLSVAMGIVEKLEELYLTTPEN